MKNVARLTVANARDAEQLERHERVRAAGHEDREGTTQTTPTPIASAIQAAGSAQALAWPRMTPNARPPTASAATSAPSQSNRPVVSVSRDSLHVAERRPQREGEQRHVDEEREPPADRVDQGPADDRAEDDQGRTSPPPRSRTRARAAGPSKAWVMSASEPGMSSAPGGALGEPEDDQPLERRGEAAQRGRRGEPDQPDGVDPAPAVVVGQGAGQDQQRGQHREVAADDVGLALEDADERSPAAPGRCA